MKRFYARNKKVIEIFLTLVLVCMVGGYYYLIYIPERENEIMARRFRTLQRIEQNMREKIEGYQNTIKNSLTRADEEFFRTLISEYNEATDTSKFHLVILDSGSITKKDSLFKRIAPSFDSKVFQSFTVLNEKYGKKLLITYDWYKYRDNRKSSMKHIKICARIDYSEFVKPLLKKGVFDQYIVFNVKDKISNIVYEDFPSGISFDGLDSLFDTRVKIYTSKIVKIETGGEKYLAFLHPCGYNNKNDRIVAGLLKQKSFDKEKRRLPDSVVTTVLFITLFSLLLMPVIRLALMGKRERIKFVDLFTGYFSFLLLVPVIMLAFFWNNKRFLTAESAKANSKKNLADQISKSLNKEIEAAYNLLDTFDRLHSPDSANSVSLKLSILDTFNISQLKDSVFAHHFIKDLKAGSILPALKLLDSIINPANFYKNAEYVFWMDSTGKEISNWSFTKDPPRGNYKERHYFKDVRENNLLSLAGQPEKTFAMEPVISRIDGKFKVVISKRSRNNKLVAATPARFESVINPLLPLGYEFSIVDGEGNTIFDTDTTENLNKNLIDELIEGASLKVVLDTKTAREFETRHDDEDFNVLAQPIPGLPYTIVIFERKSFSASLYTQCLSFTMVMMFSFFLFLCFEMILILVAHKRPTKLLKNNFDFDWIHPRMHFSAKYFSLFLYNSFVLVLLSGFCFKDFSIQRLTEYIFLFVIAALATGMAAFAFESTKSTVKSPVTKRLKRDRIAIALLALLTVIVLVDSYHYSVHFPVLKFSFIIAAAYFLLFKTRKLIKRNTDYYMGDFRLMIFSRLLLTSGLPVMVFFNCIYNFEQRLQQRLKLHNYAENIYHRTTRGEKLDSILPQLSDSNMLRSLYYDSRWIMPGYNVNNKSFTATDYSKNDSVCIGLLKTAHLHYNDVSENTESFELTRPFSEANGNDSAQFVFNNIFTGMGDSLKYKIAGLKGNAASAHYLQLASGSYQYCFPSIFIFPVETVFWILLILCLGVAYLLLVYATNKIFGKYIPEIEDFKKVHDNLLSEQDIRYLFVQGIPGSGKSSFIKKSLESEFIFCDKRKQKVNYNAVFFDLSEIPSQEEMNMQKEAYNKAPETGLSLKDNWHYKVSEIMTDKIECIVFTHFEYKIFDEYTNDVKLTLIEKVMGLGKRKIILSSDIDPLEYFYSLKKFMPPGSDNGEDSAVNAPSLEFQNRWNNLLGRFANIFMNIENTAEENEPDPFKKKFLTEECSNPSFLKNYKSQFKKMPVDEGNEEDYVLKIQSLCDHSYRQIFASLTKEEQLTLYDLAEDGLMNTTNYISLTMLLSKGLVIKDNNGVLMIINRSFRNFILTIVKADDIKRIEKEINDNQTWNDYKYPVLILLGALLYFVLSSNPEKFGNILPVITGILTGIPTVVKMLSFIKPGAQQG